MTRSRTKVVAEVHELGPAYVDSISRVFLGARRASCLCAAALLIIALTTNPLEAAGDPEQAIIEVEVEQGLLSITAQAAPLADILRTIGEKAGFTTIIRGDLDTTITRSFSGVPLDEGIRRLVGNHTMVITYHPSEGEGWPRIDKLRVHGPGKRAITTLHKASDEGPDGVGPNVDKATLLGLTEPRRNDRIRAVRRLSQDEEGIQLLARVLVEDEDRFVRGSAAVAIGKTKGESATSLLAAALEDEAASVRINAVRALGRVGDDRSVRILGDILLDHPDRRMRWMASRALGEQRSETARRALEWAAQDPDQVIRAEVNRALASWE